MDTGTERMALSAAKKGNLARLQALTGDQPDLVEARDKNGWTPLHFAAAGGHIAVTHHLLGAGSDMLATEKVASWNPLHACCYTGRHRVLDVLLDFVSEHQPGGNGKDWFLNALDAHGSTPLILAARKNHVDVVERLLQEGADPEVQTKSGKTAVDVAAEGPVMDLLARADEVREEWLVQRATAEAAANAAASGDDADSPQPSPTAQQVTRLRRLDSTASISSDMPMDADAEAEFEETKAEARRLSKLVDGDDGGEGGSGTPAVEPIDETDEDEPATTTATPGATSGGDDDHSSAEATAAAATASNSAAGGGSVAAGDDDDEYAEADLLADQLKEEERLRLQAEAELTAFLEAGSWLWKHTKDGKGKPHRRFFKMDVDANLFWSKRDDGKKPKVAYVYEVLPNAKPELFSGRFEIFHDPNLWKMTSFAFKTSEGNIYVIAPTVAMYKVWIGGAEIVQAKATHREYDLEKKGILKP